MPFHMESSSSGKSDNYQPERPGSLEKSRHIRRKFRDDTFVEPSPLERIKDKLEINAEKLQKLQNRLDICKKLMDVTKQKNDLFLLREFNSFEKPWKLTNEDLLDMKPISDKLGKIRAFLDILKTKGITTQKLENHLVSVDQSTTAAKDFFNDYPAIKDYISDTQNGIKEIKKILSKYFI